eukprot:Rmarinus@m.29028
MLNLMPPSAACRQPSQHPCYLKTSTLAQRHSWSATFATRPRTCCRTAPCWTLTSTPTTSAGACLCRRCTRATWPSTTHAPPRSSSGPAPLSRGRRNAHPRDEPAPQRSSRSPF